VVGLDAFDATALEQEIQQSGMGLLRIAFHLLRKEEYRAHKRERKG
jgi:hypothetical protein